MKKLNPSHQYKLNAKHCPTQELTAMQSDEFEFALLVTLPRSFFGQATPKTEIPCPGEGFTELLSGGTGSISHEMKSKWL